MNTETPVPAPCAVTPITPRIATADIDDWARLPDRVRERVSDWMRALDQVGPPVVKTLRHAARQLGVGYGTARARWYIL